MRRTSRFLLIMIAFYIAIAVAALVLLDEGRLLRAPWSDAAGEQFASPAQTVIGGTEEVLPEIAPMNAQDPAPDAGESVDETAQAADAEEPETNEAEEIAALPEIAPMEEAETTGETETTEEVEEETGEASAADDEATDLVEDSSHYYRFTVRTSVKSLNVRKTPSPNGAIVTQLITNATGYVLQPGNDWSMLVTADGQTGYSVTEYLSFEEVPREEFPAQYVDQVLDPDGELTEKFTDRVTEVAP